MYVQVWYTTMNAHMYQTCTHILCVLQNSAYFGADWIFCLGLIQPGESQCTSTGVADTPGICRECIIGAVACRDNMASAGSLQLL